MADIEYKNMPYDRFVGLNRNSLIRIAAQMWEYRFGGDRADIIRAMRDDFEVIEATRLMFTFLHDGEEHLICTEDMYEQCKQDAIESMVDEAQYEFERTKETQGWYSQYVTFDAEAMARDLEISGDADGFLSPWDGVVECLSTITWLSKRQGGDNKCYSDGYLYTWRTN